MDWNVRLRFHSGKLQNLLEKHHMIHYRYQFSNWGTIHFQIFFRSTPSSGTNLSRWWIFPEGFEVCIFLLRISTTPAASHPLLWTIILSGICSKGPLVLNHLLCLPTSRTSVSEDRETSETSGQAGALLPDSCVSWKILYLKSHS